MLKKSSAAERPYAKMLYTIVLITMTLASFAGAWGLFREALKGKA